MNSSLLVHFEDVPLLQDLAVEKFSCYSAPFYDLSDFQERQGEGGKSALGSVEVVYSCSYFSFSGWIAEHGRQLYRSYKGSQGMSLPGEHLVVLFSFCV